jgi:Na+/proline symporter
LALYKFFMNPVFVFSIIAVYFSILVLISWFTSRNSSNETFFTGNRQSPWFVVAFGMIGASLSGVTFISIPGEVGAPISGAESQLRAFSYFQIVIGYLLGYFIIARVLMPLYYRLNLVSIYTYLAKRYGKSTYKTGSLFFLMSQTMGAALRLFLVAGVLQIAFFDAFGIPFIVTVTVTILLIWVYTYRSGIKTIVWTDTMQTFFMILAVAITIIFLVRELDLSFSDYTHLIEKSPYSKIFFWNWKSSRYFWKQFFAGAFIVVVMTGLDQNMMQKNLTCKSLKDAQKNMYWFSAILVPVNFLFLSLGMLLYIYASRHGVEFPTRSDDLYPILALNHFTVFIGIVFLLGIIAAAFSSADSALTALTTAFCVDFLNLEGKTEMGQKRARLLVHVGFSFILFLVIVIFRIINNDSVISAVFTVAGYTYGPLLGLYSFGLFTRKQVVDKYVPYLAVLSPVLTYLISLNSETLFWGYKFGFEVLILNGLIMFTGLLLITKRGIKITPL